MRLYNTKHSPVILSAVLILTAAGVPVRAAVRQSSGTTSEGGERTYLNVNSATEDSAGQSSTGNTGDGTGVTDTGPRHRTHALSGRTSAAAPVEAVHEQSHITSGDSKHTSRKAPHRGQKQKKRIKIGGDFRYRHEYIDQEGRDPRHRHRIRARITFKARVSERLSVHVRLATGGSDPVSTNQTLDSGFSTKPLGLDRAYAVWKVPRAGHLKVMLGKMKTPWYRAGKEELMWDDDLSPEGMAVKYRVRLGAMTLFTTGGLMWAEERSSDEDTWLAAMQAGLRVHLSRNIRIVAGGSFFRYSAMKGHETLYAEGDGAGNTTDASGLYTTDFHVAEGFAELRMKAPVPVRIYGDIVMNTAAEENGTAWLAGIRLGPWHDFFVRYNYRVVQANALVGAFSDSDFIGGGTDGRGHEFGAAWHPSSRTKLSLTWFENEKHLDSPISYRRVQVDFSVNY